jgi:hypothetical protein
MTKLSINSSGDTWRPGAMNGVLEKGSVGNWNIVVQINKHFLPW